MAGNKQHHFWQLLQRGFGEKRKKFTYVWVYEKGEAPRQKKTENFGFEEHFYGPENSLADLTITNFEDANQLKIQQLRAMENGSHVDPDFAASLITHLEIRTEFLRSEATQLIGQMTEGLANQFRSPDDLRVLVRSYLETDPKILDEFLGKNFVHPNQRENASTMIKKLIDALPDETLQTYFGAQIGRFDAFSTMMADAIKLGQNKALTRDVSSQNRTRLHLDREYEIYRPTDGFLILPDTTLAFINRDDATPFSQPKDNTEVVVIPISKEVAILGKTKPQTNRPLKTINRILAGCAYKAFVGHEQSDQLQSLTNRIGKFSKLMRDEDVKKKITF